MTNLIDLLMVLELHQALEFCFLCGKYFTQMQIFFLALCNSAGVETGNLIETTKMRNHQHTRWEAAFVGFIYPCKKYEECCKG